MILTSSSLDGREKSQARSGLIKCRHVVVGIV